MTPFDPDEFTTSLRDMLIRMVSACPHIAYYGDPYSVTTRGDPGVRVKIGPALFSKVQSLTTHVWGEGPARKAVTKVRHSLGAGEWRGQ